MKQNFLLDTWTESGTGYKDFKNLIHYIDEHTEYITSKTTSFFSIIERTVDGLNGVLADYNAVANFSDMESVENFNSFKLASLKAEKAAESHITDEYLKEASQVGFLIKPENGWLLVSSNLLPQIAKKAGLGGSSMLEKSVLKDLFLAECLIKQDAIIHPVRTDDNGVQKVFGAFSDRYIPTKQSVIIDIKEKLEKHFGNLTCDEWAVNHFVTKIDFTLPKVLEDLKKKYDVPRGFSCGIRLQTSDVGESSLTSSVYIRLNGVKMICFEHQCQHRQEPDIDEIIASVNKGSDSIKDFLAAISEDKETSNGHDQAIKIAKEIGVQTVLGKKKSIEFVDALKGKTIERKRDIPPAILSSVRVLGLSENPKRKLEDILWRIPFSKTYKA